MEGGGGVQPESKLIEAFFLARLWAFLRWDPYYSLHISEEGGRPPPKNCAKFACLVTYIFFLHDEGPTTLLTWVLQNRQGKLHP